MLLRRAEKIISDMAEYFSDNAAAIEIINNAKSKLHENTEERFENYYRRPTNKSQVGK